MNLLWLLAFLRLGKLIEATRRSSVAVDFFVFLGDDGKNKSVAPRTSMNINPPNDKIGFHALCKDRCPVFEVVEDCGGTPCRSYQMRWCKCVAELLVKDLASDFGALLRSGSPPVFTLGDYVEVSKGQDYFDVRDGHTTLYSLMEANASHSYARRSGRVAVWVSNNIVMADQPDSMLAGTTLLDQPLWQGGSGAGVLLNAQTDRSSKVLSHEVGHIVGFHHTAGPSFMYKYDHPECPKEDHVETHPLVFPTCDVNIMGYWYDGPYCCPGSFLQMLRLRAGRSRRPQCLKHSLTDYQEAHCCGDECAHSCPKVMPEPSFATKTHGKPLAKMLHCWLHLRTVSETKPSLTLVGLMNATDLPQRKGPMACVDYGRKLGSCTPDVRFAAR